MLKFYKMIFVAELIIRHLILSTFEVFIVLLSAFIKQNQINIILVSIHKIKKFTIHLGKLYFYLGENHQTL